MSLILSSDELDLLIEFLERRCIAASHSEEEYVEAARKAHRNVLEWIKSDSNIKGSFMWVCDALDLEPDAVRRALTTKKMKPLVLTDLL